MDLSKLNDIRERIFKASASLSVSSTALTDIWWQMKGEGLTLQGLKLEYAQLARHVDRLHKMAAAGDRLLGDFRDLIDEGGDGQKINK